jgi:hypothetical protein
VTCYSYFHSGCGVQVWSKLTDSEDRFYEMFIVLLPIKFIFISFELLGRCIDYWSPSWHHPVLYYLLFYSRKTFKIMYYYLLWLVIMDFYYFIMINELFVYFLSLTCMDVFTCNILLFRGVTHYVLCCYWLNINVCCFISL